MVTVTKFFNNAKMAFIFRIDDYQLSADDSVDSENRFFRTFIDRINSYGKVKTSIAVITREPHSSTLDPFNENSVEWLRTLITQYGHEAASHTRWHNDIPRTEEDVLGAIDDIEGLYSDISYLVLTYIFPYGHYDDNDLNYMAQRSIPVGCTTTPGLTDIPNDWRLTGITDRITKDVDPSTIIANIDNVYSSGGVYILFTHPTTYEWDNAIQMDTAIAQVLDHVTSLDGVWYTTFGELWSYTMIRNNVQITQESSTRYRVIIDYTQINNGRIWKVPITIEIDVTDLTVFGVNKNGNPLPQGDYENAGAYNSYREFYRLEGNKLYVTIVPTGDDTIEIVTEHFQITSCPSSISVRLGESFTINVTVANNGTIDGTVEIRLKDHNNNLVMARQVIIAAGDSTTVKLTATAPSSPGIYTWKVEAYNVDSGVVDDSKSFTVEVSGVLFGGIDIQQMMQLFLQLLPLIMLILLISILVAAIR